MDISNLFDAIYQGILQFMPLFRMAWIGTLVLGAVLLVVGIVLKKNPARRKSPWIVGGIGLLIMVSSGTQLISSLL